MKILGLLLVLAALGIVALIGFNAMQQNPGPAVTTDNPAAYRQALADAQQNGKPIMLMFTAEWCGPCRHMKTSVFPNPAVQAQRPKWNWVVLDVDQPANQSLAREFKVRGIPAFFFLDPNGKRLESFSGSRSPDQFAAILRKHTPN